MEEGLNILFKYNQLLNNSHYYHTSTNETNHVLYTEPLPQIENTQMKEPIDSSLESLHGNAFYNLSRFLELKDLRQLRLTSKKINAKVLRYSNYSQIFNNTINSHLLNYLEYSNDSRDKVKKRFKQCARCGLDSIFLCASFLCLSNYVTIAAHSGHCGSLLIGIIPSAISVCTWLFDLCISDVCTIPPHLITRGKYFCFSNCYNMNLCSYSPNESIWMGDTTYYCRCMQVCAKDVKRSMPYKKIIQAIESEERTVKIKLLHQIKTNFGPFDRSELVRLQMI